MPAIIMLMLAVAPLMLDSDQRDTKVNQARVVKMEVTAYCVEGETASGEQTRRGIVAADPAVLPLGSVINVQGLRGVPNGMYTVEDTGRQVKGSTLDVFMHDCAAAKKFGRQSARVRIVKRGEGR